MHILCAAVIMYTSISLYKYEHTYTSYVDIKSNNKLSLQGHCSKDLETIADLRPNL